MKVMRLFDGTLVLPDHKDIAKVLKANIITKSLVPTVLVRRETANTVLIDLFMFYLTYIKNLYQMPKPPACRRMGNFSTFSFSPA